MKTILCSHVQAAYEEVIKSDKQKFKAGYWNRFSEKEHLFLEEILGNKSFQSDSKKVIDKLKAKFVIKQVNGDYGFTSKLFKVWTAQLINDN